MITAVQVIAFEERVFFFYLRNFFVARLCRDETLTSLRCDALLYDSSGTALQKAWRHMFPVHFFALCAYRMLSFSFGGGLKSEIDSVSASGAHVWAEGFWLTLCIWWMADLSRFMN